MKTRFLLAEQVTAFLLQDQQWAYSPIVHCHVIAEKYSLPTSFEYWQAYNRCMIRRCDKLFVLDIPGWKESIGVKSEIQFAKLCGLDFRLISEEGLITFTTFEGI